MNTRLKSGLLLFATLCIGMLLGALLNARMAEQRFERIAFMRAPGGFARTMDRAIKPTSDEQRNAIRAILDSAEVQVREQSIQSRSQTMAIIDSTRSKLRSVLTPEQIDQLDQRLRFDRQGSRRDGVRGGRRPTRRNRP